MTTDTTTAATTSAAGRRPGALHGRVVSTSRLTPSLVRVVLGGDGLAGFAVPDATDAYVNLAVPPAGAPYGPVFDPATVRAEHDRRWWPARRRYTVRAWDAGSGLLTVDFVVHGTSGVAGPWAEAATPGDVLVLEGPSGGYRPDPDADWHLMVGDESAFPAIAASLERVAAGRRVVAVLLCDNASHELDLSTDADLDLHWLHRDDRREDGGTTALADRLATLILPEGRADAFVHGEAEEVRAVRRHLLAERGFERAAMSCSPYWRRTMTDDAWRQVKQEFVAAMEADVA